MSDPVTPKTKTESGGKKLLYLVLGLAGLALIYLAIAAIFKIWPFAKKEEDDETEKPPNTGGNGGNQNATKPTTSTFLDGDSVLDQNKMIESPNKMYWIAMQEDGNLVLYTREGNALWSSGTSSDAQGTYKAIFAKNGDIIINLTKPDGEIVTVDTIASQIPYTKPLYFALSNTGKFSITGSDWKDVKVIYQPSS